MGLDVNARINWNPRRKEPPPLCGDCNDSEVANLDFDARCKHISTTYGNDFLWNYLSFAMFLRTAEISPTLLDGLFC